MSLLRDNSRFDISARRVCLLTGAGLVPFYIGAVLFIDPTFRLLALSVAGAIAGVVLLSLWSWRERVIRLYSGFPTGLRGASWGFLFWFLVAATFFILGSVPNRLPDPFHFIVSRIYTVCAIFSFPVAVGGWFFLWGDNGPPDPLLDNPLFNMLMGIAMNMFLGALLFSLFQVASGRDDSQRPE